MLRLGQTFGSPELPLAPLGCYKHPLLRVGVARVTLGGGPNDDALRVSAAKVARACA